MNTLKFLKIVGVISCCWLVQAQASSVCDAYSNSNIKSICTNYCDNLDCDNPQHDSSLNLQCIANFFKWKLATNGAAIPCPVDAIMISNQADQSSAAIGDLVNYSITVLNQSKRYIKVTSVADEFNNASPTAPIGCTFSPSLPGWLAPGESASCSFAHQIGDNDGAQAGSVLSNTVLANGQFILGQKVKPASATAVVNVNQTTIVPSVDVVRVTGTCQTLSVGSTTISVAINGTNNSIPALNVSLSSGSLVTQTNNCDGSVNPCSITVATNGNPLPPFPGSLIDTLVISAPNGATVSLDVIGSDRNVALCLLQ
ncbi:MAG: hypothetical protein AB7V32_04720 [Candidatus Berkiella sp.]